MMTCIIACIIDCLLGDPQSTWHPVALIGRLIGFLDNVLYRAGRRPQLQLVFGGLVVVLVLIVIAALLKLLYTVLALIHSPFITTLIEAFLLSFTFCPRTLAKAGMDICRCLEQGDLTMARKKVSYVVGRDTETLPEDEVVRATVETVAENTTDGIVSPLFFYALGGLPLAVLYRAVNTMDSMLGYKNDKYLYFGRAAARLDDVCNYLPARLTGLFFIAAAAVLHFDYRNAWRILRRDAAKHPSPNGGYAEATVAGALHIRLGGYNSYFGKMTFRAYMGDPLETLQPVHIRRTIRLMYTVTAFTVLFVLLCWIGR